VCNFFALIREGKEKRAKSFLERKRYYSTPMRALYTRALKSTLFTFKDIPTFVLNLQVLFLQNLNMQNLLTMPASAASK